MTRKMKRGNGHEEKNGQAAIPFEGYVSLLRRTEATMRGDARETLEARAYVEVSHRACGEKWNDASASILRVGFPIEP